MECDIQYALLVIDSATRDNQNNQHPAIMHALKVVNDSITLLLEENKNIKNNSDN